MAMWFALKIKLAIACAAGLAAPLAIAPLATSFNRPDASAITPPDLVEIAPRSFIYRQAGDFTRGGKQDMAPLATLRLPRLAIMTHQVSAADYQACVDDRDCRALDRDVAIALDRPAVQVSWHDAAAYAAWLSRRTGAVYRLPTDEEWAFAAGSRFSDDGLAVDDADPSRRWLARYEREAGNNEDSAPRAFGSFGLNEHGVADLAGNVWEWTSTCFTRSVREPDGRTLGTITNCGVRVAEGAHRAYVTDFIRDARAGGCASGTPPANLGFRLVRETPSLTSRIADRLDRALAAIRS